MGSSIIQWAVLSVSDSVYDTDSGGGGGAVSEGVSGAMSL